MDAETLPQYEVIALNIAARIASGAIHEGAKLYGRSVLASEYHVSAETVRKAVRLLADMKVVEVKEKSGSIVISTDNAKRFLDSVHEQCSRDDLELQLNQLLQANMEISKKISVVCNHLIEAGKKTNPLENNIQFYEVTVFEKSDKVGKNLASLHFWQATGATIVAIRRDMNLMVSPGPDAELYPSDVVIFVGAQSCPARVEEFLNP